MLWHPKEIWSDEDVFVLGGGPSLKGFDWNLLRGKHVIGCNNAINLGFDVCEICFFSDYDWFQDHYTELSNFPGYIVTHCTSLASRPESWIRYMPREPEGLFREALGFGGNSGVGALNLALILGAKRVFLLGIDCCPGEDGEYYWSEESGERRDANGKLIEPKRPDLFSKFRNGFGFAAQTLPKVFPDRKVFNLNPKSALKCFPFMSLDSVFKAQPV